MKVLKNDLEVDIEVWDDPGDYPSNAGSGPLPSYKYIAGVDGEVVVELTEEELNDYLEDPDNFDIELPSELKSCTFKVEKVVLTLSVKEFEAEDCDDNY